MAAVAHHSVASTSVLERDVSLIVLLIMLCSFSLLVAAGYAAARRAGVGVVPDVAALVLLALLAVACGPVQCVVGALCVVAGLNEGAWRAVGGSRRVARATNRSAPAILGR